MMSYHIYFQKQNFFQFLKSAFRRQNQDISICFNISGSFFILPLLLKNIGEHWKLFIKSLIEEFCLWLISIFRPFKLSDFFSKKKKILKIYMQRLKRFFPSFENTSSFLWVSSEPIKISVFIFTEMITDLRILFERAT